MRVSRRELGLLFPLIAGAAVAPTRARQAPARTKLATAIYHHTRVPYEGDAKKKARHFFTGETHGGFNLEVHETVLGAGVETHAPHKHVHEEVVLVVAGTVETWVEGKTEIVEAGSVIYFGSNQMHSARNAGKVPSRYVVVELRGDEA